MTQKINDVAQASSKKHQWISPEVWDLSVGRTQSGDNPNVLEGVFVPTVDGGQTEVGSATGGAS